MAMGCGVYSGPVSKGRDFCKRCGIRRSIHRRWKVVEGGENKEATMSAYAIETSEAVPAGRKAAVVDAMKVLLLADPGAAIHVQVSDAERWAEAKATMHPSKVRLVSVKGLRVCEAVIVHSGDIVYNLTGPAFYPSREQWNRMLDERLELAGEDKV